MVTKDVLRTAFRYPRDIDWSRNATLSAVCTGAALAVIALSAGAPAATADNTYVAFLSPTRNISCELNFQRGAGIPDETFCFTESPAQSVRLEPTGSISVCNGVSCLANAAEGTPTLAYGQTIANGPFTCQSEFEGVSCTVKSGQGFQISNSGVTPLG